MAQIYKPEDIIISSKNIINKYAIIILNRPIDIPPKVIIPMWNNAAIRITVDAGTDYWINYINQHRIINDIKNIDIITGDFISISERAMKFAEIIGATIIKTPNEIETDFTKCLRILAEHIKQQNINLEQIIVMHQNSGRIDHIIANINTIMMAPIQKILNNIQISILSDESISFIIKPGKSIINIPEIIISKKSSWCSLIPIGKKCDSIISKGLKWNLRGQSLEIGEFISTSNTFTDAKIIEIEASSDIMWSMDIIPIINNIIGDIII